MRRRGRWSQGSAKPSSRRRAVVETRRRVGGCHVVIALLAVIGTVLAGSVTAAESGAGKQGAGVPRLGVQRGHALGITGVAFSRDGRTILTGSRDMTARLWEASTGREIRQLKIQGGIVTSVAFSPDGRTVLT